MFGRKRDKAAPPPPPAPARPRNTARDLSRQNQRVINRAQRDLAAERMRLEAQERKIVAEIKALGRQNRVQDARVLAKHLVAVRDRKAKTFQASVQASSIGMEASAAATNAKVVDIMGKTTEVIKRTNEVTNQGRHMEVLQQFDAEKEKYKLNQEMTDELLDSTLGDMDADTESEAVLNSVLDEIGLEVSSSMGAATPAVQPQMAAEQQRLQEADELQMMDRLAKLGVPSTRPS